MLDKRFIREHPDDVKKAVREKGINLDVDELLDLDRASPQAPARSGQDPGAQEELGRWTRQGERGAQGYLRNLNDTSRPSREDLAETNEKLQRLMLLTPTIPWAGAPVGPDESANVTIRIFGTPPEFDFQALDHVELLEKRGWADFTRARKVSGERAYALTGDMVLLERAVHSYALDLLRDKDFTLVSVPSLVREKALIGTGQFPAHREETYAITADDLYLAGTAEVALVGFHSDEILDHKTLPIRYAGISPCFRREAGSAGRDVRGLLRVHQFEKVEQFVICAADPAESDRWHEELLGTAEQLLQGFGLAYEVVECSTGDMGAGKYRMNDINTWMPSLGAYRETHSCSSLHDWQARRANIRYKDADGAVRFAYTLNNTAVATPRILAALVENFQTSEAQVRVPAVLRPYLGGRELL